jgi:transcriptional regulator GlxA family with amidase domain
MEIAVLVCNGVSGSALTSVLEVFDTSNAIAGQISEPERWNVTPVGFTPRVRTSAGHVVDCESIGLAESTDLLVVPAINERRPEALIDIVKGRQSRPARELLAETYTRDIPIASACAGTFLLAETGILDGIRAATNWRLAPSLSARYPRVRLDQQSMVVHDDDITTAGAAFAHLDLALALVRAISPAVADLVAHYLVVDERPSQAPYIMPSALAQHDPTLAAFERWARERLDEPVSIPDAAKDLGVGERTLQRSILRIMGTTPTRYVQDLRVERALHLLRTTDLPFETISRRVGYQQSNPLRTLLRRRTGKTTATLRTPRIS